MSRKTPPDIAEQVRRRADFLCEYCHTNERWQYVRFTIDHTLPNGDDSISNLALACFHCNRHKSNKTGVYDKQSGRETPLFNPRKDVWKEHFAWSDDKILILEKTAVGRVTIDLLKLNRARILTIRLADVAVNRHPPNEDLE